MRSHISNILYKVIDKIERNGAPRQANFKGTGSSRVIWVNFYPDHPDHPNAILY